MQPRRTTRVLVAGAAALGLWVGTVGVARADYAPSSTDVVGVGGETPQYNVDFGADGDTLGDLGYNAANNVNKLVNIDATADANGRAAYADGSTPTAPKNLNATVVYRAGTNPVQRPTSTGGGYSALLADTGTVHKIDYIRAASIPTAAQQATAADSTHNWGFLHVVQIGTDPLQVVGSLTTHAPAGLSAADLVGIYKGTYVHWSDIPGNSAGSGAAIVPMLPPSGSSIQKTFLADLQLANGGVAPKLASTVLTVEQNDPGAITSSASPDDAIVPFSIGRLNLWNAGYFKSPATAFPGGAVLTPGVKALSGTTPDSPAAPAYSDANGLYIVFRQSDATLGPWQPGSTKNWSQVLFSSGSGTPFFKSAAGQALVAAAGATPGYSDLGNVNSG